MFTSSAVSFVVVRGQNTSVNEDLNVIITYSLEYQELRDDNVHSVQGGKFDEFEEVFPVVLDIMGCEDPSTYRLKGRGNVECTANDMCQWLAGSSRCRYVRSEQ